MFRKSRVRSQTIAIKSLLWLLVVFLITDCSPRSAFQSSITDESKIEISPFAVTSGGVSWLDPLQYQKPAFVSINVPDESTTPYKYYVDMSAGAGTLCSQSSPCANIDNVLGKPGTLGGPAYIYLRGTGAISLYNDTFYGSPGQEIVIKPWPGSTATITGNSNMNSPSGVHHIILDGGPGLALRFNSNGTGTYVMNVMANDITIYRTQTFCTGSNRQLGWAVGGFAVSNRVSFINNEFYGCAQTGDQSSSVYVGPGDGGGYNDFLFKNNIVRDFFGEGIEINPRVTSTGITITGNAIHNVGKGTCATAWRCRPGITMSIQSGGGNNATVITNNLIWDIGSGCIWDRGGGTPKPLIANNSCYDYGKGEASGNVVPQGISGYNNGGTAVLRNNIIYSPNGESPFDGSPFTASNNLCGIGKYCGSASPVWSQNSVLSTDPNSSLFLKIGSTSEARNTGYSLSILTVDYAGVARPQEASYDIGAFEFVSGGSATPTPVPTLSPTPVPTSTPAPTPSGSMTSSTTWQSQFIGSQTANFTIEFDAVPNSNLINAVTGLSQASAGDYTSLAAIVRFNDQGYIDARSGSVYTAVAAIPYSAGQVYHFRLDVDMAAHTYSAFVTPPNSGAQTIGLNLAFRTEQAFVSSLSYLSVFAATGSHTISQVVVKPLNAPTPTPTPVPVDTQAPQVSITSPANGATVPVRSTVTITATATDNVGVSRIEFYVNGNLQCTDTTAPYSCSWLVPRKSGRAYQLQVKAIDIAGNAGLSSIVSVTSK
jgi:hypothetical protein